MDRIVEMRRRHTMWNIKQNATEIIINRLRKVRSGGGFDEEETTIGPFLVRLYVTNGSPKEISNLAGQKIVDGHYGLLADYQTDIKADTNTTDKFEIDGTTFEVKAVFPQSINGEVVGYQCEVERVM